MSVPASGFSFQSGQWAIRRFFSRKLQGGTAFGKNTNKKAAAILDWIAAAEISAHKIHPPAPYDEELVEKHI